MKDAFKVIPVSTLIVIYLFICGILYLIGFWGTFKFDVFSFISIYDVPKNFVFPLLVSQGFFVLTLITGGISNLNDDRESIRNFVSIKQEWSLQKKLLIGILTAIKLWLIALVMGLYYLKIKFGADVMFWSISTILISYYLIHQFVNIKMLKENILSKTVRSYIAHALIFFPLSCFSIGKITSLEIYNNQHYKLVKYIDMNSSLVTDSNIQIKFLGYISDFWVTSSLDNEHIYIYNKSAMSGIELVTK